jgi:ABC-type amino acid transport substrate-binding protein
MIQGLVGLLLVISLFNNAYAKPQIHWCLGTFPGFYGFNAVTKQPEGPSVQYLQEIARRANFTLVPSTDTPLARCFAQLSTGETDLMINVLKTGAGRPGMDYIQFASRWPDQVFFAAEAALRLDSPQQLSALTLVTVRNYKLADEIQQVVDGMKKRQLTQVDSVLTALQMAAKQRVDAAVLPPTQVKTLLQQHPELAAQLKSISFSEQQVKPQPAYIVVSKICQCDSTVSAITRSIHQMASDGTAEKIFKDKLKVRF